MSGRLDPWDRAIYKALQEGGAGSGTLDLEGLSAASGLPVTVLEALERLGILIPESVSPTRLYSSEDATALRAGKLLLESGVPLDELMALATQIDEAMRPVAERTVEVFVRFVRDSVEFTAGSDHEAAEQLVEAYQTMMSAAGELVAGHFRRMLLQTARAALEKPTVL